MVPLFKSHARTKPGACDPPESAFLDACFAAVQLRISWSYTTSTELVLRCLAASFLLQRRSHTVVSKQPSLPGIARTPGLGLVPGLPRVPRVPGTPGTPGTAAVMPFHCAV